ncbi:MAG: outer membrane protein assembly factor BamB family protein, partial [Planctomycetota bacterium]
MRRRALVCTVALVLLGTLPGGAAHGGTAESIIKASGVKAGLCVHLGVTDGKLTAELSSGGKLVVHGLAADAASVEKARKHIQSKGLYGKVSVERSDMKQLPHADNLVNLVVVSGAGGQVSGEEIARVLAPGGVVLSRTPLPDTGHLKPGTSPLSAWKKAVKPWPKEMDSWPYFDYGPEGNPVSQDTMAGPATSLRWRVPMYSVHCRDVFRSWVSAGGRMFQFESVLMPDGYRRRAFLSARDGFNGSVLWRKAVSGATGSKYGDRNVVATSERLYLPLEPKGPIVALDAATGELKKSYDSTRGFTQIMVLGDKLIAGTWNSCQAVDLASGKQLWSKRNMGGQFVFAEGQLLLGSVYAPPGPRKIVSLNPDSGEVNWEVRGGGVNQYNGPFYYRGTLVLVKGVKNPKRGTTVEGYSAKDGKKLWGGLPKSSVVLQRGGCYMAEVFGAQGLVWIHAVVERDPSKKNAGKRPSAWIGVDPVTGEIKKRYDDTTSDPNVSKMLSGGTHRCNRGRATER